MLRPLNLQLLPLLLLIACNKGDPKETGETDTDTDTDTDVEAGCNVVDGGDGYKFVADAITRAGVGSTIDLCAGEIAEAITVDKELTFVGASDGTTVLVPPSLENAVNVTSTGDVTISDVAIRSTQAAFDVEGGTLTATQVTITEVGTYGVDALGGQVHLDGVTIASAPWGGIQGAGGAVLDVKNSTITEPTSFGVKLDGGSLTMEATTIDGAVYTGESSYLFDADGAGVWGIGGAAVTLTDVTILNSGVAGVQIENGTLTMDGGAINQDFAAVLLRATPTTITGADLGTYFQYGMLVYSTDLITLNQVQMQTDPESSAVPATDSDGSIGIVAIDTNLDVNGGVFSGNNHAAMIVQPDALDSVKLDISDAVVDDNSRYGIAVFNGEIVATDTTVSHTHDNDALCYTDTGWSCNMAVAAWDTSVVWTGGEISDNESFGLAGIGKTIDVVGGTFARNTDFGLFAQNGALTSDGTTFDGSMQYGLYLNTSNGVVTNATFSNGYYVDHYEYESDGVMYGYDYYYYAQDGYVYNGELEISNSTFLDGERGFGAYLATLDITDSTFTNYNQYAISAQTDSDVTLTNTTMTDVGGYGLYCYNGALTLDTFELSDVNLIDYRYDSFTDGTLTNSYEMTYTAPGLYGMFCTLGMQDVTISDIDDTAVSCSNCSVELEDVTVTNTGVSAGSGESAFDLSYSKTDYDADGACDYPCTPEVFVQGLTVDTVGAQEGFAITGWLGDDGEPVDGTVDLSAITVGGLDEGSGTATDGIVLDTLTVVTLDGVEVSGAGANGIKVDDVTSFTLDGTASGMSGVIDTVADDGIYATASNVVLGNVTVQNAGGSGIHVLGGTHSFLSGSVQSALEYGLECEDSPTFDVCDTTLTGDLGSTSSGCNYCVPE